MAADDTPSDTTETAQAAARLLAGARDVLTSLAPSAFADTIAALPLPHAEQRAATPCGLPVLDWLSALVPAASARTEPLVTTLVAAAPHLAWGQTYSDSDVPAAFLARYGWTELVGLRGPFPHDGFALGFLLLGPDTEYPAHRHEAEELYIPLAGAALWQSGPAPFEARSPGATIHHAPWTPHAMCTHGQPLLALYLWRGGNLTQKSLF